MADLWHVDWLREGVEKWNHRRKKVTFTPDLSGLKLFDLLPSDFRDAPKTSRYFEKIDLSNSNLQQADLSGLNFTRANLSGANLSGADLSKSNFNKAKFSNTDLSKADISNSLFDGATFENSILSGVSFEATELGGAIFINSDISDEQRQIAKISSAQIFSDRESYRSSKAVYGSDMKAGEVSFDENLQPIQLPSMEDGPTPKFKYDVFFATNRVPMIERDAVVSFSEEKDSKLNYGICEVIIPQGHKIGSLGSPLWKRLLNREDDRLHLKTLISLNSELFWANIHQTSAKMKKKEKPTIFIHGYKNTFEDAVLRAAQIGYDLGLGQGIGLFSWPSKGSLLKYSADEASSEASKYALADYIEQFIENSDQKSINIIAHSMGCRCTLGAIEVLSNGRKSVLKAINQIILAAADVDTAIMPNLGPHAVNYATRTTSYISDKDKALLISGWLHDYPRVGITPPTFVLNGMDTVLVNNLSLGDFSHGYIGTSRTVLNDIFNLLKYNSPPDERHSIEAVISSGSSYWRIKD